MHIILTGATGTAGSAVLQHCLAEPSIAHLTVLSRRPVPLAEGHSKATVVIHEDFTQYPQSLLDTLKGAHGCVWALGISQSLVSKEEYIKITHDYTMAAATAFATLSDPFNFVYVSGEGADPTERSFTLFGKVKGRTENELHALSKRFPSLRTFALRPGLIDPEGDHLRERPRTLLEVTYHTAFAPVMRRTMKWGIIGTRPLARALTDIAIGSGEPVPPGKGVEADGRTLSNIAIRQLAGV